MIDPIAYAWCALHPLVPFPAGLLGAFVPPPQPKPRALLHSAVLAAVTVTEESPSAEASEATYIGPRCPYGHTVRYRRNGRCAICARDAVNRYNDRLSRERPASSAESVRDVRARKAGVRLPGGTPLSNHPVSVSVGQLNR